MSKFKEFAKKVSEFETPNAKIFERNPDTGEIRSRDVGDYGNEKTVSKGQLHPAVFKSYGAHAEAKDRSFRESILSDIWAANKKVVNGKWYVELSQIVEIIGGDNVGK